LLDGSGIPVATSSATEYPRGISFDGTNYLIVWQRGDPGRGVYAARVSSGGTVLDPGGFPISTINSAESPSVAFDGTNYLVTWTDYRAGYYRARIYGARITTAGAVLDPAGIYVLNGRYGAVAFDGTNYLVTAQYDFDQAPAHVVGARVTPGGTVVDQNPFSISNAPNDQTLPRVAFDGTNYLVVWEDRRTSQYDVDVYGARVSPAGNVLDPIGIPISVADGAQSWPSVAFDGTESLVVWQDGRNPPLTDIYAARVSPAGSVLDPGGIGISAGSDSEWYPWATPGPARFIATAYTRVVHEPPYHGASGSFLRIVDMAATPPPPAAAPPPPPPPPPRGRLRPRRRHRLNRRRPELGASSLAWSGSSSGWPNARSDVGTVPSEPFGESEPRERASGSCSHRIRTRERFGVAASGCGSSSASADSGSKGVKTLPPDQAFR
jgi:hypothetical protein